MIPHRPKRFSLRRYRRIFLAGAIAFVLFLSGGLAHNLLTLRSASNQPVDAFLVLGGSIRREIYVSHLAKQSPEIPILISTGSDDPCVVELFDRIDAPLDRVWLEKCADSTFGNFFFGQPILSRWGVRHVRMFTSESHLPRAAWMARIVLGSHGIWVDLELVEESGVPGNRESALKTTLDVTRATLWAFLSQIFQPSCDNVVRLPDVDLATWCEDGFSCEYQGGVDRESICVE
ncbi:MAG: YdcF family protein [Limnospira sp.]